MPEDPNTPEGGAQSPKEEKSFLGGIFSNGKVKEAEEVAQGRLAITALKSELEEVTSGLADEKEAHALTRKQLEELQGQLTASQKEVGDLKAQIAEHEKLNPNKESEQKIKARAALENHVPTEGDLPAGGERNEDLPANEEELEAQLKECKTHEEKSRLVKQFRNRSNN